MHQQRTEEKVNLIFQLIENFNLECGFEGSFKMVKNKLLRNRFLLGIPKGETEEAIFCDICKHMDMSEKYLEYFQESIADANMVFLGFEENEKGCIYKVYLEFWDKLKNDIHNKANKTDPFLLHLGFKWDTLDNTKGTIARYTCYPLLSVKNILQRISYIYDGYQDKTALEIVQSIITYAANRIVKDSFIYLEVSEDNNPRYSFDINLYKANLQLEYIYNFFLQSCQYYSISHKVFSSLYKQIYEKKLGHLSGGINREGNDFLTIYYEV